HERNTPDRGDEQEASWYPRQLPDRVELAHLDRVVAGGKGPAEVEHRRAARPEGTETDQPEHSREQRFPDFEQRGVPLEHEGAEQPDRDTHEGNDPDRFEATVAHSFEDDLGKRE